ncbi:MAG: hypothetical protein ABR575_03550 [Actinomycetota bacterium]
MIIAGVATALLFGPDGPLGGFWRPAEGSAEPSGLLIPGFIAVALAEGLALGIALAVLVFGRPWFNGLVPRPRLALAAWIATIWLLASWWPHTATHRFVGDDLGGLLAAEWIFHVTSMVAGAIVVVAIATGSKRRV